MPGAIIAVIALIAIGGVVIALDQVESDAEREATKPALVVERPKPPGGDQPTDVAAWPTGTSAYTVALAEAADETSARARATAAVSGGVPAGVLHSDSYPTLDPGKWLALRGALRHAQRSGGGGHALRRRRVPGRRRRCSSAISCRPRPASAYAASGHQRPRGARPRCAVTASGSISEGAGTPLPSASIVAATERASAPSS